MIASIVFDDTIPLGPNRRDSVFRADEGWSIVETSPGRVTLKHADLGDFWVVSNGLPYTLLMGPEPIAPSAAIRPIFADKKRGR